MSTRPLGPQVCVLHVDGVGGGGRHPWGFPSSRAWAAGDPGSIRAAAAFAGFNGLRRVETPDLHIFNQTNQNSLLSPKSRTSCDRVREGPGSKLILRRHPRDVTACPRRAGVGTGQWRDLPSPGAGSPKIRAVRDGSEGGPDFLGAGPRLPMSWQGHLSSDIPP